jgi:hypothetical protein
MDGNNVALDVSDLRCTFRIEKIGYQAINYGDISIYNLSSQTQADIIKYGMRVVLEAGYENGQYGKIFDGDIFQPLWDRENVVDYKLTLHCFDGDSQLNNNFVGMTVQASHDQRSDLLNIMKNARNSFSNGQISTDLDNTEMPRGKVFFGMPKKYFREIANANNHQWSYVDRELVFSNLTNIPVGKALVVSPETGLIGTPQQTQDGVEFKVLLDPNIKVQYPAMQVKIDNSVVRQQKIMLGQLQTRLDQDGFYYVASVTHCGDTRGDDWYTEVIGFNSTTGRLAAMYEIMAQNLN